MIARWVRLFFDNFFSCSGWIAAILIAIYLAKHGWIPLP